MKSTTRIVMVLAAGLVIGSVGLVLGSDDHDDDDDDRGYFSRWFKGSTSTTASAEGSRYLEECGSCHFPYQPGLLPAQSWESLMANLGDHFGEDAELEEKDTRLIRNYLLDNAAGRVNHGLPNRIMVSRGQGSAPLRITETRFFRHEHDEIPVRMVRNNPDVLSFSNCGACHTRAMQGSFDEHQVKIPGYGRWDD